MIDLSLLIRQGPKKKSLVASVLLAGVASYFALNVAGSRVQQEKLYMSNVAVWYENSNTSLDSLLVTNTGETDILLSKVTIKGQEITWNRTENYVYCGLRKPDSSVRLDYAVLHCQPTKPHSLRRRYTSSSYNFHRSSALRNRNHCESRLIRFTKTFNCEEDPDVPLFFPFFVFIP